MKSDVARFGTALVLAAGLAGPGVFAQQPPARRDFDAEIRAAVQSAKTAARFDFLGTLVRTCLLPQTGGENNSDNVPGYVSKPDSAPARETWYADPTKVFDNLFFVGGKVHSSWALATSDGIILIDTIFPYNSEELIVGGLQKLGLDPRSIKYVLISHAHADHIGGAEMLQARYGARIVMGGADWDSVALHLHRARQGPARQRRLFGRHRVQFRQQHAGPWHQEFPDVYRVAAAHGRESCGRPRHRHPFEPL
jgi:metallo-beta-lactamase class B